MTKALFGIEIVCDAKAHWDFTTIVLKKAISETVKPNCEVLEVGTGPHAILSIYLSRNIVCNITASDINSHYVECALNTARINNASIKLVQSNLFTSIDGTFDIIFWNSVYIPLMVGRRMNMSRLNRYQTDWCGGESGTEIISNFLDSAHEHLSETGLILLGFNRVYLDQERIISKCNDAGYSIDRITKQPLNPSVVIALRSLKNLG